MRYDENTGPGETLDDRAYDSYPMEFAPITAVRHPTLVAVRDWFTSRARDGRTLERAAFKTDALDTHLSTLSLAKLIVHNDELIDFEVILTARTISDLFGEMPAHSARQFLPATLFERWHMVFQKMVTRRAPVYSRTRSIVPEGKLRRGESVSLPLVEGDRISHVLNSTVYGPPEPAGS